NGVSVQGGIVDGSIVDNDNLVVVIAPASAGSEMDGTAVGANTVDVTVSFTDGGGNPRASQETITINVAGGGGAAGDPAEPAGVNGVPDFAYQSNGNFTANNGTSGTLVVVGGAGTTSGSIRIGIGDDDNNENTETVDSTISGNNLPAGVSIGGANTNTLVILDDDGILADLVLASTATMAENNNSDVGGVTDTVMYELQIRPNPGTGTGDVDRTEQNIDFRVTGVNPGVANNATPPGVGGADYTIAGQNAGVNPGIFNFDNQSAVGTTGVDIPLSITAVIDGLGNEPTEVYRLNLSQVTDGTAVQAGSILIPTPNEDGSIEDNALLNLNNATLATAPVTQTLATGTVNNTIIAAPANVLSVNGIGGVARNFVAGDSLVLSGTNINGDSVDLESFGGLVVDTVAGTITRGGATVATFAANGFPTTGNFTVNISFTGGGITQDELELLIGALDLDTGAAGGADRVFNFTASRTSTAALPPETRTATVTVTN
ncbi:MAG: hypothetical protein P1V97_12130, partial [Planctomycetota bacterium]|nr:hypothetical protein [Planctomycetota bacterium]